MPITRLLLPFVLLLAISPAARADLKAYAQADDAFSVEVIEAGGESESHPRHLVARLQSQRWQGIAWWHWVHIVMPETPREGAPALLWVLGGNNQPSSSALGDRFLRDISELADQTGSPVVTVGQVPNQPLFGGRHEDALIALSFARYLETGDDTWPLLLPMTRSVVAAMDAAESLLQERFGFTPDGFVVTGASKRGWTAYLAAAADDRVRGIAPMVFDLLNIRGQLEHQKQSLGRLRPKLGDYTALDLPRHLDSPRGRELVALVDPYAYRRALTVPKMVLLTTNDPYWATDAAQLYFHALPAPKWLAYEPNTGHGLGAAAYPALRSFLHAVSHPETAPQLSWEVRGPAMTVQSPAPGSIATVYRAKAPTRDFLEAEWQPTPLSGPGPWSVDLTSPNDGAYAATYVHVLAPQPGGPQLPMSTPIYIRPDRFSK